MYTTVLYSIRHPGNKVKIRFNKDPLALEQNYFAAKVVNAYTVYDLDAWSNNPLINFTLKCCWFFTTTITKGSDKEKWVYSSYGIVFDGKKCGFLAMALLEML